jgi:hypothetical protein
MNETWAVGNLGNFSAIFEELEILILHPCKHVMEIKSSHTLPSVPVEGVATGYL